MIEDFESQMNAAVAEEHEGKRKNELSWSIHRLHWEKNRFIYDVMYVRKVLARELVSEVLKALQHALSCTHLPMQHTANDRLLRLSLAVPLIPAVKSNCPVG